MGRWAAIEEVRRRAEREGREERWERRTLAV
jgi:hypothetical protein